MEFAADMGRLPDGWLVRYREVHRHVMCCSRTGEGEGCSEDKRDRRCLEE
jgi:hypothetical protein